MNAAEEMSRIAELVLVEERDDPRQLVLDELHPKLGRLVHDLELHHVVRRQVLRRLLERKELGGTNVLLVVGERCHPPSLLARFPNRTREAARSCKCNSPKSVSK